LYIVKFAEKIYSFLVKLGEYHIELFYEFGEMLELAISYALFK